MTKLLERKARSGNLLATFELFQASGNSQEAKNEWLEPCWHYFQEGENDQLGIFRPKNDFYLRSLSFTDFRRFASLKLQFDKHLTVIIGNNGQGKSSILTAIAKTLSWFSANILRENVSGQRINEWVDIKNDSKQQFTDVFCDFYLGQGLKYIPIRLSRSAVGVANRRESLVKEVKAVADIWRIINDTKTINLPTFAFYSVERSHPYNRSKYASPALTLIMTH